MKLFRFAVLYMALALGANAAPYDKPTLEALREGEMHKLSFHSKAKPAVQAALIDEHGKAHTLDAYKGKYVLLNFWATWCHPCRKEMPSLDRLQAELGSDTFSVVTVATGHNPVPAITRFFGEKNITHLPILRDPQQTFARDMSVLGLPVTLILDPKGREIARLHGDAEWDSDSAKAILRQLSSPK